MTTAVATPTRMRTPEYSAAAPGAAATRDAQRFENEYFQYLKPESFTVLPADENPQAPSPPRAPEPYKLTPRKRHKNQAFSIIAEPGLSAPNSRAGSPTGRVSPFRGRGFNPTGSRHASPAPSPPPGELPDDDAILRHSRELQHQLRKSSIGRSQIPILKTPRSRDRRSSTEDLLSPETSPPEGLSPTRSNLQSNARYSKSMINIAPRNLSKKPPPSPRRTSNLKASFVRLSPIIGSSPEVESDHMSSPSRIPRSRSQPPSRIMSPNGTRLLSPSESRNPSRGPSRPPSRGPSRPVSRNGSRSASREPSPGRSPSKIPMKSSAYKNIPAKVDTFSRVAASSKPKVPQKPKVYSTRSSNLDRSRPSSIRKNVNKSQIGSNKSPRREPDDTETTDTDRDISRTNTRSSINTTSRRNSISKPSTSGYSKQQNRSKYNGDGEKPSTSRGYSNNKTTTDSYDRSSTTSTVVGGGKSEGNYSSKTSVKRNDSRSNLQGTGSKTNSQTFRKDGAKESRSRRHDTTTATSTTEDLSKSDDDDTTEDAKDDDILSVTIDEMIGSQTTKIVSATTETVVKPLNIEAKLIKQSEANSANQSESSGNYNSNSSTNQRAGVNNSSNLSSNQKAGTNSNSSTNTSTNQKGSSNTSSNQRATTDSTTHSSSMKSTSNSNQNSNNQTSDQTLSSSNNNPVSNLTTPANGSVVNTPTSNPSNNLTVDQTQNPSTVSPSLTAAHNQMESVNNNLKHVSNSVNNLEMNVKNNFNNLTPPDSDKVSSKSLMDSSPLTTSAKMKQARTVIVDEIKPIKITVREKSGDIEVQSGNYALPRSATNGIAERPLLPPNNHPQNANDSPPADAPAKPGPCSKIFSCCKKQKSDAPATTADGSTVSGVQSLGSVAPEVGAAEAEKPTKCWDKICCKSKGGKVGDVNKSKFSCFPKLKKGKDDDNWAERRDSILSEPPKKPPFSMTLRKIFCTPCAKCKKKPDESVSRRTSMMSKKKSLSSTMQPPPEDTGPKLEASLVEHSSHMRGAIPVLPVPLAWVCLICNVFLPGFGTILSGLFCLCIGKPRFSPRDSAKARVGAFLIDVIVGISQAFTVLFCLVGWGWSIWWGVIMLKIARKHRKIERLEKTAIEEEQIVPSVNVNHAQRDVERGT